MLRSVVFPQPDGPKIDIENKARTEKLKCVGPFEVAEFRAYAFKRNHRFVGGLVLLDDIFEF